MKSMGIFKEATVIVHGDHGSRIYLNHPLVGNKEMLTDADLRDGYSALFAVKAPRAGSWLLSGKTVNPESIFRHRLG